MGLLTMSVTYNGRPFNPERFKRDVMDHAWSAATTKLEEKVRGLRCPVHFKSATVKRTASGWTVDSCCQALKAAVDARLKY